MKRSRKTPKKKTKDLYFESYDLYSDANPKDTIRVKYDTVKSLEQTIRKLERLFKQDKYSHARIVQVANVIKQRLRVIVQNTGKGIRRYRLIEDYFDFLTLDRTPIKDHSQRKKLKF
jgi:hypothetical protein